MITRECLWIDGNNNPLWVLEQLKQGSTIASRPHDMPKENHRKHVHNADYEESCTFVGLLKACAKNKDFDNGTRLHADIIKRGLLNHNPYVATSLINLYAKCGVLEKAQEVLEGLPTRNVISWSALISGYVQHGQGCKALECFEKMQGEGFIPDAITFMCVLQACGSTCAIHKGQKIHEEIGRNGLLAQHITLGSSLVDMYVKCGLLAKAKQALEELPFRNVVTWNVIITGYAQHDQGHEALNCFEQMRNEGVCPNAVTFICALKACGSIGDLNKGDEMHDEIVSRGLLEGNVVLGTALVDMYAKCGALAKSQQILDELPDRNLISWNAIIAGYAKKGKCHEVLKCREQMENEGISPNVVTFTCILQACGNTRAINEGEKIHNEVVMRHLLEKDVLLGNSLVDMYVKCGMVTRAQQVLEDLPIRNVVSWNALISGYTQHGLGHEALNCFEQMKGEGLFPNTITYLCIVKACGVIGVVDKGKQIQEEVVNRGFLEKDIVLGTAFIDMYAKCGDVTNAHKFLEQLPVRNVVSWSALISGYAQQCQAREALKCFEQMQREGLSPNDVTFLSVLTACSHSGLLDNAQSLYMNMTKTYGIIPNSEHQTCMVVALGSVGHFDKVISLIKLMPSLDYSSVWLAVLGACSKWGNVKLAVLVFDQAIQLDSDCALAYVLMSNIFVAAGRQEDAEKVEAMRLKYTSCKDGCNSNL